MVATKPKYTEKIAQNTPPVTVNRPFNAHAQAMVPSGLFSIAITPIGNGIPKKKASGKIIITEDKILSMVRASSKLSKTYNLQRITSMADNRMPKNGTHIFDFSIKRSFSEAKLPTPAPKRKVNKTVV